MNQVSNDTRLEIAYDHYKESCSGLKDERHKRDRLLLSILVVLIFMSFHTFAPIQATQLITELVSAQLGLTTTVDFSFIGTAMWFILAGLVVRYFQTVINVERGYPRLHRLEEQLCEYFDVDLFVREGKSYLGQYPTYLKFAHYVYVFAIPLVIILAIATRLFADLQNFTWSPVFILLDVAACLVILTSVLFYWRFVFT